MTPNRWVVKQMVQPRNSTRKEPTADTWSDLNSSQLCRVKKGQLQSSRAVWFHLFSIVEMTKLYGGKTDSWLPGVRDGHGGGGMEGSTVRCDEGDFTVRDKSVSWSWCTEGRVRRSRKQWPQQHGNKKTVEQCLHNSKGNWFPAHISISKSNGNQLYGWNKIIFRDTM